MRRGCRVRYVLNGRTEYASCWSNQIASKVQNLEAAGARVTGWKVPGRPWVKRQS